MLATVWSLTRTHCRSTTRPPYRPNAPRISAARTYADAMITHAQHPVQERPSVALASTNPDPVLSVVAPAFNEAECLSFSTMFAGDGRTGRSVGTGARQ